MRKNTATAPRYTIARGYTPTAKLRWIVYRDGAYYASGTTERQAQNLITGFIARDIDDLAREAAHLDAMLG